MSEKQPFPYPFPADYFLSILDTVNGEISAKNFFKWLANEFYFNEKLQQIVPGAKQTVWQHDVMNVASRLTKAGKLRWNTVQNDIIWTANNNNVNNVPIQPVQQPPQQYHQQQPSQQYQQHQQRQHVPHQQQQIPPLQRPPSQQPSIQHRVNAIQHNIHNAPPQQHNQRYSNSNQLPPQIPQQAPPTHHQSIHAASQQPYAPQHTQSLQPRQQPIPQQPIQQVRHQSQIPPPYQQSRSHTPTTQQQYQVPSQPSPARMQQVTHSPVVSNQLNSQQPYNSMQQRPQASPANLPPQQQRQQVPMPLQQQRSAPPALHIPTVQNTRNLTPSVQQQMQQPTYHQAHRTTSTTQMPTSIPSPHKQPPPMHTQSLPPTQPTQHPQQQPTTQPPIDQTQIDKWKLLIIRQLHNYNQPMPIEQLAQRVLQPFQSTHPNARPQFTLAVKQLVKDQKLAIDKLATGESVLVLTTQYKQHAIPVTSAELREKQRHALKSVLFTQPIPTPDQPMDTTGLKQIERALLYLIQLINSLYDSKLTLSDADKATIANQIIQALQVFDQSTDSMLVYLVEQINKIKQCDTQYLEHNQYNYSEQMISQLQQMKHIRDHITNSITRNNNNNVATPPLLSQSSISTDNALVAVQTVLTSPEQPPIKRNNDTNAPDQNKNASENVLSRETTPINLTFNDDSEHSTPHVDPTPQSSHTNIHSATQSPDMQQMFDSMMSTPANSDANDTTMNTNTSDVTPNMLSISPTIHTDATPDLSSNYTYSPNNSATKADKINSNEKPNDLLDVFADNTIQQSDVDMGDKFSTFYQSMNDDVLDQNEVDIANNKSNSTDNPTADNNTDVTNNQNTNVQTT